MELLVEEIFLNELELHIESILRTDLVLIQLNSPTRLPVSCKMLLFSSLRKFMIHRSTLRFAVLYKCKEYLYSLNWVKYHLGSRGYRTAPTNSISYLEKSSCSTISSKRWSIYLQIYVTQHSKKRYRLLQFFGSVFTSDSNESVAISIHSSAR